jgi:hypothetical protein
MILNLLCLYKSGLGLGSWGLRCNCYSCAVDNLAILNRALDQPVVLSAAGISFVDTALAKVKVAIVADAAVIMLIRHRLVAVVAVDREDTDSVRRRNASLVANGVLALIRNGCKFGKPFVTSSAATGDGDLSRGSFGCLWIMRAAGDFSLIWAASSARRATESRVVDQKLFESALKLVDGSWLHGGLLVSRNWRIGPGISNRSGAC